MIVHTAFMLTLLPLALATLSVDWPSFLGRADPMWHTVPTTWYDSAFVGNGKLGAMVKVDTDGATLKLDIGNSGVWDDRMPGGPGAIVPDDMSCNRPRLPIGGFLLDNFAIDGTTFKMKIGLYDAEVTGSADDIDGAAVDDAHYADDDVGADDDVISGTTSTDDVAADVDTTDEAKEWQGDGR